MVDITYADIFAVNKIFKITKTINLTFTDIFHCEKNGWKKLELCGCKVHDKCGAFTKVIFWAIVSALILKIFYHS